jgi:hypothetical protein
MWQANWNLLVPSETHASYTLHNCSVAVRLVSMTGPQRECDMWKISKRENVLPQTVDKCKILPETEKVAKEMLQMQTEQNMVSK